MPPTTILIGGHKDGLEITAEYADRPIIAVPACVRPFSLYDGDGDEPIRALYYHIVLNDFGSPSIDDQGRYRHKLGS